MHEANNEGSRVLISSLFHLFNEIHLCQRDTIQYTRERFTDKVAFWSLIVTSWRWLVALGERWELEEKSNSAAK